MQHSRFILDAQRCLDAAQGHALTVDRRRQLAIELAGFMLCEARRIQTPVEKRMQAQLAHMMSDPSSRAFVTNMTDQCFRTKNPFRIADQLIFLIDKFGVPRFLPFWKKLQFRAFRWLGRLLAPILVPLTKHGLRREMASVIVPGEPKKLSEHMHRRRQEGVRINLNHLGEAILGEEEANRRMEIYLNDLANPEVEYISVKVSTILSQINLVAMEDTLAILGERLKRLFRKSKKHFFTLPNGYQVPKFVNLDMEEYRDLILTVNLFQSVLNDAEFIDYSAGIVLQSYLPDAFMIQEQLTTWAMQRVENGGAPIKIRIVKGANLAMERVEASMRDWEQAPYLTKGDVDANYKHMLHYGCEPERANAVHLGVASHNLFDIAYAMLLRVEKGVEKNVGIEMLEGMADHIRRVVQALSHDMLLYCPAATEDEFQNAMAYLIRRFDENTAPENFLRHAFDMIPGTKEWQVQADLFSKACAEADHVSMIPRRQQNRLEQSLHHDMNAPFENEADTDWSLPKNRAWANAILHEWKQKRFGTIPLVIGKHEISSDVVLEKGEDPSCPGPELYRYALAGQKQLDLVLKTAEGGFQTWTKHSLKERLLLLDAVARGLRRRRRDLIGAMIADTGKTIPEADVEVSEAIDFAMYYSQNVEELHLLEDVNWKPKGTVLVAPPWNFPCSIPAGGILAALTAGNSVIFKPAPEAVLVGWELAKVFWEAGVDRDVLQFFCCPDDPIGSLLVQDSRIASVVLTGATSTAKLFMKLRPGLDLMAETGGKNAMIITCMADRDLAVRDLVQSAFGHAGQKCSACSLAILDKEIYEDPHFRRQLCDAAASLKVGSAWSPSTRLNPLIRFPNPVLLKGLTTLEEGEEWLLKPKQDAHNPHLWSPGIKLGVKAGSFTHQTELFGPVLGLMCAKDLDEAIAFANATPYGLTAGVHTLDEREQLKWKRKIVAGNCYVNRTTTGAIVRRQPFGGCKESSFGPGAKAGGPNYVMQLMHAEQTKLPTEQESLDGAIKLFSQQVQRGSWSQDEIDLWQASLGSYAFFWKYYFSKPQDPSRVLGQDNLLCYVPRENLVLRVQEKDRLLDVLRVMAAAMTCGASLKVSADPIFAKKLSISNIRIIEESEEELIVRLKKEQINRIRFLSFPSESLRISLAEAGCNMIVAGVMANGRLELLHFLREVSYSVETHRYGYLGFRENDTDKPAGCRGQCCGCSC